MATLAMLVLVFLCYTPYAFSDSLMKPMTPPVPLQFNPDVEKALNEFTFDLHKRIIKRSGSTRNVFLSPLSVYQSLAIMETAARGETKQELLKVLKSLNMSSFPRKALGDMLHSLIQSDDGVVLRLANRIWVEQTLGLRKDYKTSIQTNYGVKVKNVDFQKSPHACRTLINRWIAKVTINKIPQLLSEGDISAQTRAVITNAIYFKGFWETVFDKRQTREDSFIVSNEGDKTSIKAKFMTRTGNVLFARTEKETEVIDLPYAGGRYSMSVFLPASVDSKNAVDLTLSEMKASLKQLRSRKVKLMMPKFNIRGKYDLKDELIAMGLKSLFTPKADLSGMGKEKGLFLTKIIHQAVITVNEKGSEASAATAAISGRTFLPVVKLNRPFTFLIRDRHSGLIIFIGKLSRP